MPPVLNYELLCSGVVLSAFHNYHNPHNNLIWWVVCPHFTNEKTKQKLEDSSLHSIMITSWVSDIILYNIGIQERVSATWSELHSLVGF